MKISTVGLLEAAEKSFWSGQTMKNMYADHAIYLGTEERD